jgi:hypothetical protein
VVLSAPGGGLGIHGLLVQPMEDGLYSTGLGGGLTIGFVMREASYLLFLLAVFFFGLPWWPSMYYTLSCLDLLNCGIINKDCVHQSF